jgi:hypothetical protein
VRVLALAMTAKRWSAWSPIAWPKPVVDRLEMIEIEHQRAHRLAPLRLLRDQCLRRLQHAAPVEQPGQFVGQGGGLVDPHAALRGQHQNDEGGADRIEHHLQHEQRDPSARERERAVVRRQHAGERNREQEHRGVQHRNENGRPTPAQGLAALAP